MAKKRNLPKYGRTLRKMGTVKMKLNQFTDDGPFHLLDDERDEHGQQLMVAVFKGEAPSHVRRVKVADLEVHSPARLARVTAALMEHPSHAAAFEFALRGGVTGTILSIKDGRIYTYGKGWATYRSKDGRLVMFDDYVSYVVAKRIGLGEVTVEVFGEAEPHEQAA